MVGENLLRFNKNQLYLVFDGETENLNLLARGNCSNKPWQWSYQIYKGTTLLESHDEFLWWDNLQVSKEAAFITRFDYNTYKEKATDPMEALRKFDKFLYDPAYKLIGANLGNFDVFIHNIWRRLMGKDSDFSYFGRIYDIQCIEKAIELQIDIPTDPKDYLSFLFRMYGFRRRGLKTNVKYLLKKYGIEFDEFRLHDGAYDIEMTKAVFDKQIWAKEF